MPLRQMTRAQLAVLWLWARCASLDTRVHMATVADVLQYPEIKARTAGVN